MEKTSFVAIVLLATLLAAIPFTASAQEVPKGPWVDEIVFFKEPDRAKAIEMLKANQMDVYFFPLDDAALFNTVKVTPELWYRQSFGLHEEITFNPVGPEFPATGKLNPFAIPAIREAIHYLINRDYVVNEISKGLSIPRYTTLTPSFPDYAKLIDTARKIELEYAYNFDKGKSIITSEMEKLGATLVGGKWNYEGEQVTLKFIIRTEDERRQIGDYLSGQLESIGFVVDRQYKTSAEASPIWMRGNPADGAWHIYTGGWVTTVINRDEASNFDYFFTPRGRTEPLWQAYKPDPEFDLISERLGRNDFASVEERAELMARALELSMKDSARVWVVNRVSPWVARDAVTQTSDLAGGFYGCYMWPQTIRFVDTVGGSVKIASSDLLTDPWNPVAGSNWIYDQMVIRATFDQSLLPDPFTGLWWPNRLQSATVEVESGLPVFKSLDWLTLRYVSEGSIVVPTDAWYDWNATTQSIITAPSGTTARTKVTLNFDPNLFDEKYHDGTNISLADFVFQFIYTFDRGDPASPVYDSAYVPTLEAFKKDFKGFKITSADPLVIDFYSDVIYLDAEYIVQAAADTFDLEMSQGGSPWHLLSIGWLAESKNLVAFGAKKAESLGVEWMSYIAGPSVTTLREQLDAALAASPVFIPYRNVLATYITDAEATAKYNALKTWHTNHGHLWVGNGVFYVDSVDTLAPSITLKAFGEHPDKADKWAGFTEPKIPELSLAGPSTVIQTLANEFNISVTFKGQTYPTDELDFVKYLVIGPAGDVRTVGSATPITDGQWKIILSAADTSVLPVGSNKIEVVVASKLVSIPSTASASFVTGTFQDFLSGELGKLRADLNATITSQGTEISDLSDQVTDLQGTISTLNTTVIIALAVAVVAIIAAVVIAVLPRLRKK